MQAQESQYAVNLSKNYSADLAAIYGEFLNQRNFPVAIIYGNPETGKTDTACQIAEVGLAEGWLDYIASNIYTNGVGSKITSLEEVKYWHRTQKGNKLFILDEAGINDDARNPFSRLNREIRHEIFIARKFNVHWIFILQELKDIDNWKNSNLTGMKIAKNAFNKTNFSARIRLRWWEFGQSQIVYDFPKTSLPYDTLDIGIFTLERQSIDDKIRLKGLEAELAAEWVGGKSFGVIGAANNRNLKPQQVKRKVQDFIKLALRSAPAEDSKA